MLLLFFNLRLSICRGRFGGLLLFLRRRSSSRSGGGLRSGSSGFGSLHLATFFDLATAAAALGLATTALAAAVMMTALATAALAATASMATAAASTAAREQTAEATAETAVAAAATVAATATVPTGVGGAGNGQHGNHQSNPMKTHFLISIRVRIRPPTTSPSGEPQIIGRDPTKIGRALRTASAERFRDRSCRLAQRNQLFGHYFHHHRLAATQRSPPRQPQQSANERTAGDGHPLAGDRVGNGP